MSSAPITAVAPRQSPVPAASLPSNLVMASWLISVTRRQRPFAALFWDCDFKQRNLGR
jgi:hypothetical protein